MLHITGHRIDIKSVICVSVNVKLIRLFVFLESVVGVEVVSAKVAQFGEQDQRPHF